MVQETATALFSGQPLLNAGRDQSRTSQNSDPLKLKGRHFFVKKQRKNVIDVYDVIKWVYNLKLCINAFLAMFHHELIQASKYITQWKI